MNGQLILRLTLWQIFIPQSIIGTFVLELPALAGQNNQVCSYFNDAICFTAVRYVHNLDFTNI
jgi:hypothetical protein